MRAYLFRNDKQHYRHSRLPFDKLPECTRYTKQQLNFWRDLSWSLTVGHARDWLAIHNLAPETREGINAFVEKRGVDYAKVRRDQQ